MTTSDGAESQLLHPLLCDKGEAWDLPVLPQKEPPSQSRPAPPAIWQPVQAIGCNAIAFADYIKKSGNQPPAIGEYPGYVINEKDPILMMMRAEFPVSPPQP